MKNNRFNMFTAFATPLISVQDPPLIAATVSEFPTQNHQAGIPRLSEQLCREFCLGEILIATRYFDEELIIGKGGFGSVYRGSINDGTEVVAIKRLSFGSMQGETEFLREIETLSKIQHNHLVHLKGYCNASAERILVYEYMPNGTLVDHLYKTRGSATTVGDNQQCRLTWENRLNICIGAARGLDFLHRESEPGIIHRDIKDSNILLDDNFVAKIADFGLAKLVKTSSESQTTIVSSTGVKGTFGYLDPEYFYTQRLTKKADVYAFGIVLLVVLCGRPAVDNKARDDQRSLAEWAQKCIQKNRVDLIIDPYMAGKISSKSLKHFVKVSQKCLLRQSEQRPTMEEVVAALELAFKKQSPSGLTCRQPNVRAHLTQTAVSKLQITPLRKKSVAAIASMEERVPSASVDGCLCPQFSLDEIKTATQNFSKQIGQGGYGRVYLRSIDNGAEAVAIKRFGSKSVFLGEIGTLCKLEHDNIIRLKGYCNESSEMILAYEYMSKGSLENHLYKHEGNHQAPLTWEQRLRICLGAARGLDILHRVIEPSVIHCNVKCSNIMLDDNLVPKIIGFDLVKLANAKADAISTFGRGTIGYFAPECYSSGKQTSKSDVYSFGVVLLVVLSGRAAVDMNAIDDRTFIVQYVEGCQQENIIEKLLDPDLRGQFKTESLEKFLEVAQNCLNMQPQKRHTMEDVVAGLELALEKQLSFTMFYNPLFLVPNNDIMQDVQCSNEGEFSIELLMNSRKK